MICPDCRGLLGRILYFFIPNIIPHWFSHPGFLIDIWLSAFCARKVHRCMGQERYSDVIGADTRSVAGTSKSPKNETT